MSPKLPQIYLARHGETAWSITGQHTGLTNLPLTPQGEDNARRLGERLEGIAFAKVYTSTLQRARQTCELAGYSLDAQADADLVEWNYGDYEGRTTDEIRRSRPDWEIFRDGCPGGETIAAISARADRVIELVRAEQGNVLLFSSAHFLRVLAARWCGQPITFGRYLNLDTASLSGLGYFHNLQEPAIRFWNDCRHTVGS